MPLWLTIIAKCDTNDTSLMIKNSLLFVRVTFFYQWLPVNLQQLLCFLVFCRLLLVELLPWSWRGLDESSSRLREDRLQAGALVLQSESSFTKSRKEYSEQDIRSCSPNQFLTAPGRAKLKYNTELRGRVCEMPVSGSMVQRKRTPMCILKKVIKNENNNANASVWNMISRTWIDRYTLHPSRQRGSRKIQSSCVLFAITHLNWTEYDKETYHANNGKAGTALFICFYLPFLSYCFKNMLIKHFLIYPLRPK